MKEFIKKLIGRLEILNQDYDGSAAVCEAIEIVNQLAEEYNNEHDDTDYANIELYAFWQKHQWIPVSERLPEEGGSYIVYSKTGKVYLAHYYKNSIVPHWSNKGKNIIAWMPLPEPYQPQKPQTPWKDSMLNKFDGREVQIMSNEEKIDYMIASLQLAKEEISYAKKYNKEKKSDDKFYHYGHFGDGKRIPNGTIIRESLKMIGRMANIVANNVTLSAYSDEIFKV